jgi:PAS domain S-box-containing protein
MLTEEKFAVGNIERVDRLSKGIDRLAKGNIDVVLLDLGLPDSQGLNTFEKINAVAKKVPVLILTAYADDALALEAVRKGAQDYLFKGKLDGALLVKAITYAIERKKSEEKNRLQASLIDLSPDAIMVRKFDGTVAFWSKGAEKLYGWTSSEAVGQVTHNLLKTRFPDQLREIDFQLKTSGRWTGELCHKTKDGRDIIVQSWWLAEKDDQGEVISVLEENIDITERKIAEEQAMEAAKKLKDSERLATIGATAGMVGHDIRNPLQAITSDVYLAKTDLASIPESEEKKNLQESLEEIEKNTSYINKIVSDLQDYTRILRPVVREINLQKLTDELFAKDGVPENVKVKVKLRREASTLMSDSDILKRILVNLITNAVQAMPKGGKLSIQAYKEANDSIITVEDTGVGVPKEAKDKLFTPLFTTKSKGQGFGLAVVKRMTEALGGTVTFESQEGKGTTFILRFPPAKS